MTIADAALRPRLNTTWLIFVTTMLLVTIGLVMVYSSSAGIAAREAQRQSTAAAHNADGTEIAPEEAAARISSHSSRYLERQAFWAVIGIIALIVAYQIDYEKYRKWSPYMVAACFIACICVFVPGIGFARNGSYRWIKIGPMQLQSSELAKLAMIIYMARQLSRRQSDLKSFLRGFVPALVLLVLFVAIIAKEPDLGAAFMLGVVCFVMFYVSGMRLAHLVTLFVGAVPAVAYAIWSKPYRMARWLAFLDPERDIRNSTYQIYQSLIAVSTGGVFGRGLGQGPQKYQFLAEAYTDFIYAVICEELGMIGALGVFALYTFFIIQGLRVARRATGLYGTLLATGITAMIGFQAFVNMGVVIGVLPTKGLTLPLISYGGSSLVVNCIAVGILMNISKYAELAAAGPAAAPNQFVPKRNRPKRMIPAT